MTEYKLFVAKHVMIMYTPELCGRAEKANTHNNKPFVPFIEVNKESFGQGFDPTDLLSSDPEKKSYARNSVQNIIFDFKRNIQFNVVERYSCAINFLFANPY